MLIRCQGHRVILEGASVEVLRALRSRLTLPNPKYIGAVKAGKVPFGIPETLKYYRNIDADGLQMPGACAGLATAAAQLAGLPYEVHHEGLIEHMPTGLHFAGALRLYQVLATAQIMRFDHGVLDAPTGSGKTVMGCRLIVDRQQPTLVVVHSKLLQAQWVESIRRFVGAVMTGDVGTVGGTDWGVGFKITVGVVNTVYKRIDELAPHYGHVMIDEAHRAAGDMYQTILGRMRARYRTGLSATPWRRDGLGDVVNFSLGPTVKVERAPLVESGAVLPTRVVQVPTEFTTERNASEQYQAVIGDLVADDARNRLIAHEAAKLPGVVLVLSDRVDHCEHLATLCHGIPLHGKQRVGARAIADAGIADAREGQPMVLCATTQLIGEGFDLPAADALIVATPIKFDGRLIQAIGRVLRPAKGKSEGVIVDLCDWGVGVLAAGARARARVYKRIKREEHGL